MKNGAILLHFKRTYPTSVTDWGGGVAAPRLYARVINAPPILGKIFGGMYKALT